MLVLTRSPRERLFINNGEIIITVLEVKGSQVRFGVDAPREITVHREEVFLRIKREAGEEVPEKNDKRSFEEVD